MSSGMNEVNLKPNEGACAIALRNLMSLLARLDIDIAAYCIAKGGHALEDEGGRILLEAGEALRGTKSVVTVDDLRQAALNRIKVLHTETEQMLSDPLLLNDLCSDVIERRKVILGAVSRLCKINEVAFEYERDRPNKGEVEINRESFFKP